MLQALSKTRMTPPRPDAPVKAPLPLNREARLNAIRARLDSGYYERPEVAQAVARRMLSDVLRKDPPLA